MINNARLRKGLYALGFALGGVLLTHGIVEEKELDAYLLVVEALLGLAFSKTTDKDGTKVRLIKRPVKRRPS